MDEQNMNQDASLRDGIPSAGLCPFCGSYDLVVVYRPENHADFRYSVGCKDCHCSGPACVSPHAAVRDWNEAHGCGLAEDLTVYLENYSRLQARIVIEEIVRGDA